MKNPRTIYEKVDAAANFVEQMFLAHKAHDEVTFNRAHERAGKFLFEAVLELDKLESSDDAFNSFEG